MATVVLTVALAGFGAPPAGAVTPPVVEPGPPPSGPVAPAQPTEQKSICGVPTGVLPGTDFTKQTERRGHARIPQGLALFARRRAEGGGDRHRRQPPSATARRSSRAATTCRTATGWSTATRTAPWSPGSSAASPADGDSFAGVAPEASILSIRQNSGAFGVAGTSSSQNDDPNATSIGYGNTRTLALAIARAVDLGATVINLSEVACAPVSAGMDDRELGRAVRYAYERNVVVVAAAGNFNSQSMCKAQNNMNDPNQPLHTGWNSVSTIASPAWFSDYVLTVGAVTTSATPADFSLHGPWVAVAAPGERVTSLDAGGPGLSNAQLGQQGLAPLNGTSFAAPFVSGVVALIRSRYPGLTAGEVKDLVERTARTPGMDPTRPRVMESWTQSRH